MMRRLTLALLAATALSAPALADPNVPQRGAEDPNMRTQVYRPGIRTRAVGIIGTSLVITFGAGEEVKRVIFGDGGERWAGPKPEELQTAPLQNHLPLWPVKPGYTTLQVITAVPGKPDRPYQFALVSREAPEHCRDRGEVCDDPDATYGLRFVAYPEDEREAQTRAAAVQREARVARAAESREQAQQVVARDRLRTTHLEVDACDGWLYEGRGSRALAPAAVWNNGREMYLTYEPGQPMPAAFAVGADGAEHSVATATRPSPGGRETMVLPFVAQTLRLRLGSEVLEVLDRNPRLGGCDPGTNTPRRDVVRHLRQAAAR